MTAELQQIARYGSIDLWRDPQTVPPEERAAVIQRLETACAENPDSAALRTCLGIAYAVNYETYKSLDALDEAVRLDPGHFFAQIKLAELWYRLRALPRAEQETLKALQLAGNPVEVQLARKQLQEIRKLIRNSYARPSWDRPFAHPRLLAATLAVAFVLLVTRLWL